MRTSEQNLNWINRPTVTFYEIVIGRRDTHGKDSVRRILVDTNRKNALARFDQINVRWCRDFVRLYHVDSRTAYGKPEFKATLVRERVV
jgi:hypothetical protein